MKNQYFGDVNDYRKYGILRALTAEPTDLGICWMLTPSDGRADGQKLGYLGEPDVYRSCDPALFDALHRLMTQRRRSIEAALVPDILGPALAWSRVLKDDADARRFYFTGAGDALASATLVFFDPDNGFERSSTRRGNKNSSKYIYYDELVPFWRAGHSVLVYQHFPREDRDSLIGRIGGTLAKHLTECGDIHVFRTPHVAFFLAVQPHLLSDYLGRIDELANRWQGQLEYDLVPAT